MEHNSPLLTSVVRQEKTSDIAIFWCLVSTVTLFIFAMLKSMPVLG